MIQKINYMVEVNGRVVKSGSSIVSRKDLKNFELDLINKYRTKRTDIVNILFR